MRQAKREILDMAGNMGEFSGTLSSENYNPSHPPSPLFSDVVTETHNDTIITHNSDDLFSDYPVALTDAAAICCIIFILLGIPGNLITIIALARCKKVRILVIFAPNCTVRF